MGAGRADRGACPPGGIGTGAKLDKPQTCRAREFAQALLD
jgi:hypothetical protein